MSHQEITLLCNSGESAIVPLKPETSNPTKVILSRIPEEVFNGLRSKRRETIDGRVDGRWITHDFVFQGKIINNVIFDKIIATKMEKENGSMLVDCEVEYRTLIQ